MDQIENELELAVQLFCQLENEVYGIFYQKALYQEALIMFTN